MSWIHWSGCWALGRSVTSTSPLLFCCLWIHFLHAPAFYWSDGYSGSSAWIAHGAPTHLTWFQLCAGASLSHQNSHSASAKSELTRLWWWIQDLSSLQPSWPQFYRRTTVSQCALLGLAWTAQLQDEFSKSCLQRGWPGLGSTFHWLLSWEELGLEVPSFRSKKL